MAGNAAFQNLMGRVRAGDQDAAAELVKTYEPEIRRLIRFHLTDNHLRQSLESMDICQSVLANFFVRAAAGQFELQEPRQLLRLLARMARNKLLDQARRQTADRRDQRRLHTAGPAVLDALPGGSATPSQIIEGKELLEAARQLMSEEERFLAEQRALDRDWADIASAVGGTADAVRKKYARAVDRVARQLGLDAVDDQ
jgi:RNA polymerase sigma-70 factor (ECF subfamily)